MTKKSKEKEVIPVMPNLDIVGIIKNHFDDITSEYDKKSEILVDGPAIDNGAYPISSCDIVDHTTQGTLAAFNRTNDGHIVKVTYGLGSVRGSNFVAEKIYTVSIFILNN